MTDVRSSFGAKESSKAAEQGKSFRISNEFTLSSTGNKLVIKFVAACPFRLTLQTLTVHTGDVTFRAKLGSTESGSFATSITSFGKNRLAARPQPYYVSQVTLTSGGAISGGTTSEVLRRKVSGASGQASSISGDLVTFRELPPGTYYLEFEANENTCAFTYALEWEELA